MPTTVISNKNSFRQGAPEFGIPAEAVLPLFTASGGTGGYTWTDGGAGGSFNPISATEAEYLPANRTQVVTVTATAGSSGGAGSKTLDVSATCPAVGQWGAEGELDIETSEQKARGGTRYFREDEKLQFGQQIDMLGRRVATEGAALLAFYRFHRKTRPFYYLDTDTGELQKVRFVSPIRWRLRGDIRDYFANVRGDDEETILSLQPPDVLMILPANGATLSGSVTLSATATDDFGIQDVQFKVDGLAVGALLTSPPFQISLDTTLFGNGRRILTARARNDGGHIAEAAARIVTFDN